MRIVAKLLEYQSDQCLGNQTRARVAKGVTEDTKKRDPGLIVKNDICSSESNSFHDQLRLNSSLGGQSNNFSSIKPKIFRMLKRKKLYHPKKHYVRIQIPRKGYFYRSTVQLKVPGSTTSGQFKRMEPQGVPKGESKVQISRLASTSSKVSNLPNKKRMKGKQINSEEDCNLEKDCVSPECLDRLISHDKKPGYNFQQLVSNYLMLHWPREHSNFQEKKTPQLEDDLVLELINCKLEGEGQTNAISENSQKLDSRKTKKRAKKKTLRTENDSCEIFARMNNPVCPSLGQQKRKTSESAFENLVNCITSGIGNEKLIYDLEISPINKKKSYEKELAYNSNILQTLTNTPPLGFTEIMKAFNNFDVDVDLGCENPVESDTLYELSIQPTENGTPKSELSKTLMEEIDLHLELQNYLKEYEMLNNSKTTRMQERDVGSYEGLPCGKNEFSKVTECKSRPSFKSASSIRLQEEKSATRLRLHQDCKRNMISISEECIRVRPTKVHSLQNEFSNESDELRKIKSESDPGKLSQEAKPKSSIKRTFGKTAFQMIHLDDKETLIPRDVSSLNKDLSKEDSTDDYEKITPFVTNSNKSSDSKSKNLSRVLFENTVHSHSADSVGQHVHKVSADVQQIDITNSDQFRAVEPFQEKKESGSTEITSPDFNQVENSSKWSPTLQDIIDIYNNVLKQNKYVSQKKNSVVKDSFSSHLISFLNEKLKQKQFKANLMELSKDLDSSYKPRSNWKPINVMSDSVNVKEYVSIFQEILQSSLSINQITRLNDIISDLHNYSEQNYELLKNSKSRVGGETGTEKKKRKNYTANEKAETLPKKVSTKKQTKSVFSSKTTTQLPYDILEKTSKLSNSLRVHSRASLKSKNVKTEKVKNSSKDKINDKELEFMLKTCFDSVDVVCSDPELSSPNNKVLVNVKLSGSRILVNGLSYIKGEDSFSPQVTKADGTSELIIESITKEQLRDAWLDTKCSKLKLRRSQAKETSKKPDLKNNKLRVLRARKLRRSGDTKTKEISSDSETEDNSEQELHSLQQCRPPKIIFPFEYDQMQLRAQHPIEAIIESSESKVSEIFENSENDKCRPKIEFPSAKKTILKDISNNSTAVKIALKEALGENVFLKDLARNFDWSEDEIGGALGRTKSSVIRRNTVKGRHTKKKELAETVRSMVELNRKPCSKRKGRKVPPARLRETYLCFPTSFSLQDKSLKSTPKSKEKSKDKKPITRCSSLKATAKSNLPNAKFEVPKKISQDFGSRRQKSEATTTNAQTLDSKATPSTTVGQVLENSLSKCISHSYSNNESQRCSTEVLLDRKIKDASPLSVSVYSEMQGSGTSTQPHPSPVQWETSNSQEASEFLQQNAKGLPITLHQAKSSSFDDISFPAMIIRSESFLKCFSQVALTKSKLQTLFKSSSDMKFYPGRITNGERLEESYIMFVLTPEQYATSGLPPNRVKVVTKPRVVNTATADPPTAEANPVSNEFDASEDQLDEINGTKSLESIEKFIDQYSKYHKKAERQRQFNEMKKLTKNEEQKKLFKNEEQKKVVKIEEQKKVVKNEEQKKVVKNEEQKKVVKIEEQKKVVKNDEQKKLVKNEEQKKLVKNSSSYNRRMKNVETTPITEFPAEKKVYHECQKTKKALTRVDMKIKKGTKVSDKTETQMKRIKVIEKKDKTEKTHLFFPNKIKDFIKFLENFEKISSEKREETLKQEKQGITEEAGRQKKTTGTESKDGDSEREGKISKSLANFLPEVLEAIKTALSQVENFKDKSEIISAIEKELEEKKLLFCEEPATASENLSRPPPSTPKKLKSVKIKIHCGEQKCLKEGESVERLLEEVKSDQASPPRPHPMGEIELLNSLVLGEAESGKGRDLERRNSMYFDALEKAWPDEIGGAGEEVGDNQRTLQKPREGSLDLNAEFNVKEEPKPHFHPLLTKSDENLLFKNYFSKESEEIIMNKITASLKENKIAYSMVLLDEFMKKIENSSDHESKCFKLKRMLLMIENKSKNLMLSMEKNAWLKVLSLLEEVSQIHDIEGMEGSMGVHLQTTKAFIDRIQGLNMSRLIDLQNFCNSLSQQPSAKSDERNVRNVFGRIRESLNFLKQKFILRRGSSQKDVEKAGNHENRNPDGDSKFKVHSTLSLPDVRGNVIQNNGENHVEHIKKKIHQQKICIEQLMKTDMDFTPQEILEVKDKMANEMKWLDKMFELYSSGGTSKDPMTKAASLLNAAKLCRKTDAGRSKDKSISQNFTYSDMMQNLIKAWDKRLSLNTLSSEGFR